VSVAGTNKGAGEVVNVGAGECPITGIGAGDCSVAGVVADDIAVVVGVTGGVASVVADAFAVAGIVARIVIGACLVVFKTSRAYCGVDMLVVVVVGSSVEGVCGGNSTLGREVFILVRGGVEKLGGKERLKRFSLFNYSSKSSLNSCCD
jgi:hypothetical protein